MKEQKETKRGETKRNGIEWKIKRMEEECCVVERYTVEETMTMSDAY